MKAFATDPRLRRARPAATAPALLCCWQPVPDGHGLVARWVENPAPWYPPARPPAPRRSRAAAAPTRRPMPGLHPLLRLAAA